MESDAENAKEIETYSFLLGSAIRNEDTDQFLSIYDSIIPPGLSENQVDFIKSKAREVAELSEENYSRLVSKARDFSLAQDRNKMSHRDYNNYSRHYTGRSVYDDDSDGEHSYYHTANRQTVIDMPPCEDERRTDNDSGIYNSSKATTSLCSNSEESEGEERAASFDYFPTAKLIPMFHNDYDEAYDVESEKGSNVDLESPRSDKSKDSEDFYNPGTEMTTFRTYSREADDFETDEDSDDEVKVAPHQALYTRRSHNYYTPMTQESTEEYGENMASSTFSFDSSRQALKDKSASQLRGVDDSIHFPLSSQPSRYSSYVNRYNPSSSTGTRVEKSMYSRHDMEDEVFTSSGAKDPPFGHGRDQVDKVGKSICSLLSSSASAVDDMPEGRPISQSLDLADDVRRKKKKKKGSKDDLEDRRRNSDYDENGNPLVDRYYQMRGSPKFGSGNSLQRKSYSGSSSFPATLRDFAPYSLAATPLSELDSSSFHQSHEGNRSEKIKKRKIKQEPIKKAEDIENYVGNKEIDELLEFIESDKNGRKPKKNGQITNDVPLVSKATEKNNKKNKEKKLNKQTNEEKCELKDSKIETSEVKVIDETTPLICSKKSEYSNYHTQMGNSSIKEQSDEKHDLNDKIDEKPPVNTTEKTAEFKMAHETLPVANDIPIEGTDSKVNKKDTKEKKSKVVEKPSNKAKGKNGNGSRSENCIMNGDISEEHNNLHNNAKPKAQTNNVKHKQAAKKEPKDTASVITNNNIEKSSYLDELDLVQNEDYRFTDFEPLRKEPEFTVVGKKKKKVTGKEVLTSKDPLMPQKPQKREERRKPARSVTPPPLHNLTSSIEGDHARDLSPSAFPALGSSNQASFRDARRNSTGDVRSEVQNIIKAQDDSDIESVKSLPASSQGVWGQNSLSPRLPMSYAKMAASPKPSITSLGSSANDEDLGETSMDLKAANWKGQIKERRHSIGSHPENFKEIESGMKQKYGSQEVLTGKVSEQEVVLLESDFPKVGLESNVNEESNSVRSDEPNHDNTSLIESTACECPKDNKVTNNQLRSMAITEPAKQENQDIVATETKTSRSSDSSNKVSNLRKSSETNNSDSVKLPKRETNNTDSVKLPKSETNNTDSVKLPKQTVNSSKKTKQSVIFMDKRVTQVPNLGLSFYFDSSEECVPDEHKCSSNSPKSIPQTSDSKISDSSVIDFNSSLHSKTKDYSHSLVGKNGVVRHKNHIHTDNSIMFISEPNQVLENIQISTDLVKQQSLENLVSVTYGDKIDSDLPKETPCKQIFFRPDSGEGHQRFNFPEAVSYLNREWEKALEASRKNPNEVLIYKG